MTTGCIAMTAATYTRWTPSRGIIEAIVSALGGQFRHRPAAAGRLTTPTICPWQYRDSYVDNDDYLYRYSEGDIYQVDAQSGLIEAILPTLFG